MRVWPGGCEIERRLVRSRWTLEKEVEPASAADGEECNVVFAVDEGEAEK